MPVTRQDEYGWGVFQSIPGGLPSKYERAMAQRHKQVDNFQSLLKDAGVTKEEKKNFQTAVEQRFQVCCLC